MIYKLPSLTIFFPFYNDADTVERVISSAYKYGQIVANKLEVIAIHGGSSYDDTWSKILEVKKKFSTLRVINKSDNTEGYGVIKYGFQAAKNEWVFYTDGDGQYEMRDLLKLMSKQQQTNADLVNGYKTARHDAWQRQFFGNVFQKLHQLLIHAPIRDIHCDFRLLRTKYVQHIQWETQRATIISELILKIEKQGAIFAEQPVKHREREYGHSSYNVYQLLLESAQEILWSLKYKYVTASKY